MANKYETVIQRSGARTILHWVIVNESGVVEQEGGEVRQNPKHAHLTPMEYLPMLDDFGYIGRDIKSLQDFYKAP